MGRGVGGGRRGRAVGGAAARAAPCLEPIAATLPPGGTRLPVGHRQEGAEHHGVQGVPGQRQAELAGDDGLPRPDDGGQRQEQEHQGLRQGEVERGGGLGHTAGDVPLAVAPGERVPERMQVDRERRRREHQRLPAEGPHRVQRDHDLHEVEPGVVQEPGRHRDPEVDRGQVEVDLQRRDQQQQRGGDPAEVERGGHEVLDPLVGGQLPLAAERVVLEQDLERTGRPAQLLLAVRLDGLRGVADREHGTGVDGLPAPLVEQDGGPDVLGLGVLVDAADVGHRVAPEHHVGAHAERGVEPVLARLDQRVEDRLQVAGAAREHRVQVAVGLRTLHERDLVGGEVRHGLVEELRLGSEVRVEDDEELPLGERESVVDVARLGAGVHVAPDVLRAQLLGNRTHLVGLAVVEDEGPVPAPDGQGGRDGPPDDREVLAVRGDEHVDGGLLAVQGERPPRGRVGDALREDPGAVEQVAPRRVVGEVACVVAAGQDRPQRQQGLRDQPGLRGDHEHEGQQVAVARRPEQEAGVGQDPQCGQEHKHHQGRRAGPGRCGRGGVTGWLARAGGVDDSFEFGRGDGGDSRGGARLVVSRGVGANAAGRGTARGRETPGTRRHRRERPHRVRAAGWAKQVRGGAQSRAERACLPTWSLHGNDLVDSIQARACRLARAGGADATWEPASASYRWSSTAGVRRWTRSD